MSKDDDTASINTYNTQSSVANRNRWSDKVEATKSDIQKINKFMKKFLLSDYVFSGRGRNTREVCCVQIYFSAVHI